MERRRISLWSWGLASRTGSCYQHCSRALLRRTGIEPSVFIICADIQCVSQIRLPFLWKIIGLCSGDSCSKTTALYCFVQLRRLITFYITSPHCRWWQLRVEGCSWHCSCKWSILLHRRYGFESCTTKIGVVSFMLRKGLANTKKKESSGFSVLYAG